MTKRLKGKLHEWNYQDREGYIVTPDDSLYYFTIKDCIGLKEPQQGMVLTFFEHKIVQNGYPINAEIKFAKEVICKWVPTAAQVKELRQRVEIFGLGMHTAKELLLKYDCNVDLIISLIKEGSLRI